eukprot:6469197-Amphidinium_carterae.2
MSEATATSEMQEKIRKMEADQRRQDLGTEARTSLTNLMQTQTNGPKHSHFNANAESETASSCH